MGSTFAFASLALIIGGVIVAVCICIAPLIIWRNTNRTNRLLALSLLKQGYDRKLLDDAWYQGGGDFYQQKQKQN